MRLVAQAVASKVERDVAKPGAGQSLAPAAILPVLRTVRCAATTVNPVTALHDLDVPAALHEFYGHVLCGVYLKVTQGGIVRIGDSVLSDA